MNTSDKSGRTLTKKQKKLAVVLVMRGLPLDEALKSCGISDKLFERWIQDDEFLNYLSRFSKKYAHINEPFIQSTLLKMIEGKNVQAVKLFYSLNEKKDNGDEKSPFTPGSELETLRSEIFEGESDAE